MTNSTKQTGEQSEFNLESSIRRLINTPEVQQSLARANGKQAWIGFLETGDTGQFTEHDQAAVEMAIDFLNTYALIVAYEKHKSNEAVAKFFEIVEKMQGGQELHEELNESVSHLPADFRESVSQASAHAQKVLLETIQ
ncbi:hypothetical protein BH09DEP1_BH09DEP1_0870 [soil metagenome]